MSAWGDASPSGDQASVREPDRDALGLVGVGLIGSSAEPSDKQCPRCDASEDENCATAGLSARSLFA
jgi:hypothetical protein